jgi:formylglycine-generating enzyme required for sulfatase activity
MKRHALFLSLLCWFTLFFATTSRALTIPASEDSYTASGNKLNNLTNNANSLIVDATRKSYLYFDLSDIPADAVVRWAKLRLFLPTVRTPGAGLSVHLVTGTWNESTRLADVPSIVAGSLGMIAPEKMASRRFVTVDVKDTVQKWINGGTLNEGFAIQPIVKAGSPTASVMLTSKEGPVFGLPAELDIEFGPTFDTLPLSIRSYFGPTITAQPSAPSSGWGSLTVTASGMGPLSYQWMLNGVPIVGATSSQLPTRGLQSGTYTVVVTNRFSSVTGSSVLFVAPITPTVPTEFAFVAGGTLPASSALGAVPVDTFYIGRTEVTWGEWQTVRAWAVTNGYTDLANVGQGVGDSYPVSYVNWYDVVKWCNARSEKEGKTPVYTVDGVVYKIGQVTPTEGASANGYRLPSEKEWEFAARGGTQTQGYTYSGSNDLNAVGWYIGNSEEYVHEVGKKLENELGIYDMSGNLWEWLGGGSGVVRGGNWNYPAEYCLVDFISGISNMGYRGNWAGFRVATSGEYALGITAQPSVSLDGTTLSVEAAGAGTLTYEWRLNGVPIAGGTSSQLPTQGLQSGTYTVVVSNPFTSVTAGIQYIPSPIGMFALVAGGTLPSSSQLGALPVDTFYIGKTEVTWGEWLTVRTWAVANGYTDLANVGLGMGNNYPVTQVNWFDVVKWCNARSEREGRTPVYMNGAAVYRTGNVSEPVVVPSTDGYRLPSSAEWEFAARGGIHTHGYNYVGSNDLSEVGWFVENSGSTAHEVGKKLANELGIFDMSGNVWEWSASWLPGAQGSFRVIRGGDWGGNGSSDCAVANHDEFQAPENRYGNGNGTLRGSGFRVALSAAP